VAVERRLFPKLLAARGLPVREAARLAAYLVRKRRGGVGRGAASSGSESSSSSNRRVTTASSARVTREEAAAAAAASAAGGGQQRGLLARVLGLSTGSSDTVVAAATASGGAAEDGGVLGPDASEVEADLEAAKVEVLPRSDPEIMDYMTDMLSGGPAGTFIGFNTARAYQPDLGFFVAVDGAHRITRLLPTAALVSCAPPGSFYQVRKKDRQLLGSKTRLCCDTVEERLC